MERILPTEKYYNYFEDEKKTKSEVSDSLQIYLDSNPQLKEEITKKESVALCLLGSATHRNPENLVNFLKELRPHNHESDKIIIEEISDIAIDRHSESFELDADIPVYMTKMDMREMGVKPKSFDVLVSDFTVNFVPSVEGVNRFFKEVSRSLKDDGIALVSITCNRNYSNKNKYGYYQEKVTSKQYPTFSTYRGWGVRQVMFTLPQYIEIAENKGLNVKILARKDNEKMGPQFFLEIRKDLKNLSDTSPNTE